jgi:sulfate adenylyltransferase subunit 1 (EFTu-like GTPase family)
VVATSGIASRVARIVTFDGDLDVAVPGEAVTVTLADEVDVSRGDVLVGPGQPLSRGHDIDATVVWMSPEPARPGAQYLLQAVGGTSNASLRAIHARWDMDSLDEVDTDRLELNDIARCTLSVDRELLFDPYRPTRHGLVHPDRPHDERDRRRRDDHRRRVGLGRAPAGGLARQPSRVTTRSARRDSGSGRARWCSPA